MVTNTNLSCLSQYWVPPYILGHPQAIPRDFISLSHTHNLDYSYVHNGPFINQHKQIIIFEVLPKGQMTRPFYAPEIVIYQNDTHCLVIQCQRM